MQAITQHGRQLQLEQAEHRQREKDEQRSETAEQPGLLQRRLQVGAEQCGKHAERRIHQRHADHITAGQGEPAPWRGAHADDDAGEDRQHRQ